MTHSQYLNYVRWVMKNGEGVYQYAGMPRALHFDISVPEGESDDESNRQTILLHHVDEVDAETGWQGPLLYVGAYLFDKYFKGIAYDDDSPFVGMNAVLNFEKLIAKHMSKGWTPWSEQMGLQLLIEVNEP